VPKEGSKVAILGGKGKLEAQKKVGKNGRKKKGTDWKKYGHRYPDALGERGFGGEVAGYWLPKGPMANEIFRGESILFVGQNTEGGTAGGRRTDRCTGQITP
jgi:hypothetical protein